jgi:hypothetical protein
LAQTEKITHSYQHEKNIMKSRTAKKNKEDQNLLKYDFDS